MGTTISKDTLVLMVGRGIAFLISLITPLVLVRVLTTNEYGEYRQVMLIIATVVPILSSGMPASLFYFFPHCPDKKDIYISRTVVLIMILSTIFFIIMFVMKNHVADFFQNSNFINYSPLIGITSALLSLSLIIETVLIVEKKVVLSAKVLIFSRFIRAVTILIACFIGGVEAVIFGLIIYLASKTILSFWYFIHKYKASLRKIHFFSSFAQVKYAFPIAFGGFFTILTANLDKYLISHYLGTKLFAIYSVGFYEIPMMAIVFQSIGDVILPRIVEFKSNDKINKVILLWHKSIESSFLFGWPLFIFCMLFSKNIILTLFTVKYLSALPVFRLALIAILLESMRYGVMTRAFAKTWVTMIIQIVGFIFMLPLCYFGIQQYGIIGAASVVITIKGFMIVIELIYSKYLLSLSWTNFFPFKKIFLIGLLSLACGLLTLLVSRFLPEINQWIELIICCAFFGIIYLYFTNLLALWTIKSLPFSDKIIFLEKLFKNRRIK